MKRDEQERILTELIGGSDLADFREATLEQGLAAMRGQRRLRRASVACVLVVTPLLLVLGIVLHRTSVPSRSIESSVRPLASVPASQADSGEVKSISDEELFKLFPGRAMALIGKPGQQELVFLDGKPPRQEIH